MMARELSYLLRMVRVLDDSLLKSIADCDITFDNKDKAIIAVAKGEIEWRQQ